MMQLSLLEVLDISNLKLSTTSDVSNVYLVAKMSEKSRSLETWSDFDAVLDDACGCGEFAWNQTLSM